MLIHMDPEVAAAFQASTAVSLTKGCGVDMLKMGNFRCSTKETGPAGQVCLEVATITP